MISSREQRYIFIIFFLVFAFATLLAYFFHWDAYLYKRVQDTLVIIIGVCTWIWITKVSLREELRFPEILALAVTTIIVTMHILRAINGDLLC